VPGVVFMIPAPNHIPRAHARAAADTGVTYEVTQGFRATTRATPLLHAHGDVECVYTGPQGARLTLGGREHVLPASRFLAFWGGLPHQLEMPPGSDLLTLTIPLTMLLRWNLGAPLLQRLFLGECLVGEPAAADDERMRAWAGELLSDDPFARRTVELEVQARLRRLTTAAGKGHRPLQIADQHLASMIHAINERFRDDVSIRDIAAAAGLHPNYAMTLFRRTIGVTVWQYITRLRLAEAQVLLVSTDRTVLDIAMDAGFGSLARFYAAFTREFGMAPGQYRRQM
jgi:AraC family transcriptional regulator, melibiose operon regulatory protein